MYYHYYRYTYIYIYFFHFVNEVFLCEIMFVWFSHSLAVGPAWDGVLFMAVTQICNIAHCAFCCLVPNATRNGLAGVLQRSLQPAFDDQVCFVATVRLAKPQFIKVYSKSTPKTHIFFINNTKCITNIFLKDILCKTKNMPVSIWQQHTTYVNCNVCGQGGGSNCLNICRRCVQWRSPMRSLPPGTV